MALSFIKRVFSFGKDDKSAASPEPVAETVVEPIEAHTDAPPVEAIPDAPATSTDTVIDPVTAEHLGDRLIVPDSLHPDDLDENVVDPAVELREQAESVAEFIETVEDEPAPTVIPPDEPGIDVPAETALSREPLADTTLIVEPAVEVEPTPEPDPLQPGPTPAEDIALPAADQPAPVVVEEPRATPVLPAGFASTATALSPSPSRRSASSAGSSACARASPPHLGAAHVADHRAVHQAQAGRRDAAGSRGPADPGRSRRRDRAAHHRHAGLRALRQGRER